MGLIDVGIERAVLASLWRHGYDALDQLAGVVDASSFSDPVNQAAWRCLHRVVTENQTPDDSVVVAAAHDLGYAEMFERGDERNYLRALANLPVEASNARALGLRLQALAVARRLSAGLGVARERMDQATGDETVPQLLSRAAAPAQDVEKELAGVLPQGTTRMGDGLTAAVRERMANKALRLGVPTSLRRYDEAIGGGLRPGGLDVIAARPGAGKTQLVDNVALHVAGELGVHVLNLDTEMDREEHHWRVLANLSGVPAKRIETGACGDDAADRARVLAASARIEGMPYFYEAVRGLTYDDVLALIRRWARRNDLLGGSGKAAKPALVLFDYIKLVNANFVTGRNQEHQALGYITSGLKDLMGETGMSCLCFAQMNRQGIGSEETDSIAGSDRILMYATSLSLFKRKTEADLDKGEPPGSEPYSHKLIVKKARFGEGMPGGDYINIKTDYARARIKEGPTRNELLGRRDGGVVADTNEQRAVG